MMLTVERRATEGRGKQHQQQSPFLGPGVNSGSASNTCLLDHVHGTVATQTDTQLEAVYE